MEISSKPRFINIMTDFGFKRAFGSEERSDVLIQFLNALFEDKLTVTDVEFRNTERLPDNPDGKRIIHDVFFKSNVEYGDDKPEWFKRQRRLMQSLGHEFDESTRHHFILEMQNINQPPFEERLLYYSAREIASQGKSGAAYLLNPVITIAVTNFNFPHLDPRLRHDFGMMDKKTGKLLTDKLLITLLSLKEVGNWADCKTELERILYIIKNIHLMDTNSEAYKCGRYEGLFNAADTTLMTDEDYYAYERDLRKLEDMNAGVLYAAQLAREEGEAAGELRGEARGEAKGEAKGRAEGEAIGRDKERAEIIRSFYAAGISSEKIAETLAMPLDEVNKILGK